MTTAQKKKSVTNRQKKFQRDAKNRMYQKDTSASCKEYKQKKKSFKEFAETY